MMEDQMPRPSERFDQLTAHIFSTPPLLNRAAQLNL
jgi:hypothetical protein